MKCNLAIITLCIITFSIISCRENVYEMNKQEPQSGTASPISIDTDYLIRYDSVPNAYKMKLEVLEDEIQLNKEIPDTTL